MRPEQTVRSLVPALFRPKQRHYAFNTKAQLLVFLAAPRVLADSWAWNGKISHVENRVEAVLQAGRQCFGNPNPYNLSKKYGSTPPICTAVRPPFVLPYFPGFYASKKGKPST